MYFKMCIFFLTSFEVQNTFKQQLYGILVFSFYFHVFIFISSLLLKSYSESKIPNFFRILSLILYLVFQIYDHFKIYKFIFYSNFISQSSIIICILVSAMWGNNSENRCIYLHTHAFWITENMTISQCTFYSEIFHMLIRNQLALTQLSGENIRQLEIMVLVWPQSKWRNSGHFF